MTTYILVCWMLLTAAAGIVGWAHGYATGQSDARAREQHLLDRLRDLRERYNNVRTALIEAHRTHADPGARPLTPRERLTLARIDAELEGDE